MCLGVQGLGFRVMFWYDDTMMIRNWILGRIQASRVEA